MTLAALHAGYIRLFDAAPLIVARDLGFAEEERIDLRLTAAPSWSTLRDMLVFGQIDAAHMLAPVPVAMALGLGGVATRIDAVQVLSMGGTVIGVSRPLAARMRKAGHGFDFADATVAGLALIAAGAAAGGLRIGVPFPFSMQAELLYFWLGRLGLAAPLALDIRTVPPPLMAQAMAAGEIDAFCVGEPWGSIAVETGVGELLLPGAAIWSGAPEKVLALRHDRAEDHPDLTGRLMRAVWRAGRWLGDPVNRGTASEILARPEGINVSAEVLERAFLQRLAISPQGETRAAPGFQSFFADGAGYPWRSQAAWIGAQLAARHGLDRGAARDAARAVFRTDLYRRHLGGTGAEMPVASDRVEGALPVGGRFFDGSLFDPFAG
ncbi:MAG: ABC transporter substrate-binding protein [Paracoccaceae bacterium]|nr:ABC transporter substrate-binding protein [Paracoccaceae bacterium]